MTAGRCPFGRCLADVELLDLRTDIESERTNLFVPTHDLQPATWYGQCPASLMHFVLTPAEQESLVEQAGVYDRVSAARRREQPAGGGVATEDVKLGFNETGRPGSDRWFTSNPGGNGPGLQGLPKMEPAPRMAPEGRSVATVAESRAAGQAVNVDIAEAMRLAVVANDAFEAAAAKQAQFVGMCGGGDLPQAGSQLASAASKCEAAMRLGAAAAEINESYMAML